ncbi:hypothetical protein [Alcanivorax sp.]|jgi:hypothetical protein|uniref:hypothetical protein n=1 Tax=Alcanivorax sp. TaxID=1872427 RepID=UPI0032D91FB4
MNVKLTPIDFPNSKSSVKIDGKEVFAIKYESKHSRLFSGYESIEMILTKCLKSAEYIQEFRKRSKEPGIQDNINAHFISGIINYARCFTKSAKGKAKLERSHVPEGYKEIHDTVMRLRHDYIAHSGNIGEHSLNLVALYPHHNEKQILHIDTPRLVRTYYLNDKLWDGIIYICPRLIGIARNKMAFHYKNIKEEINNLNIDDIYKHFESEAIKKHQYRPNFTPGTYTFRLEIDEKTYFNLIGTLKKN